jgi:hypothetical protein
MSYAFSPPVYATSPAPHVYTPKGWDSVWKAGKAASGTTPAWCTWIGDSYMQGSVCSDFMVKSFRAICTAGLVAKYTRYGDFWPVSYSTDFVTFSGGTFNGTPPWTVNSTTSRAYLSWMLSKPASYSASNAANPILTFVTPYACTALDILHSPNAVGSWQYSVDGGATQTVNTTATAAETRIPITALANTTHTVTIFNIVNANACIIDGICTYANTTGVGYGHLAYSGASMRDYISPSNSPSPRNYILQGRERSTVYTGNFGFPTQPHLAIIALGLNDTTQQLSLSLYEYGLADMCEALRGGRQNASILILGQSSPDTIHSDVTTGLSNTFNQTWRHYLAAQERVAHAYNCAWVNIHAKWGDSGAALGFQAVAQQHPNDNGHADIAAVLGALI